MPNDLRTEVHFRSSAFNTSEPKDYFINECCYGDDLCKWLMQELCSRGFRTDSEPGQEDFGWYFCFYVGDVKHCFVVGFQPADTDAERLWIGWLEHQAGFLGSLLGGRKRGILPEAAERPSQHLVEFRQDPWHCLAFRLWQRRRGRMPRPTGIS